MFFIYAKLGIEDVNGRESRVHKYGALICDLCPRKRSLYPRLRYDNKSTPPHYRENAEPIFNASEARVTVSTGGCAGDAFIYMFANCIKLIAEKKVEPEHNSVTASIYYIFASPTDMAAKKMKQILSSCPTPRVLCSPCNLQNRRHQI